MMHLRRVMPIAWVVVSLFLISGTVFAQGKSAEAKARHFGIGQPKNVQDLPYGKLRKDMERLSPKAKGKALGWLQRLEFPAEDVASLRVNSQGEISYADSLLPDNFEASDITAQAAENASISLEQAFLLHTRPGASNVLYLDFDGHTFTDTAWGSGDFVGLPFDPSENDSPATVANFTQDELTRIHEIWHRIAEDYAPFNIDVTTEEPAVFTSTTGRLLFTHDTDANGRPMPHQGVGGTAMAYVFGLSNYATNYSPALIYYTNLSPDTPGLANLSADAASHEFGHNIGLSHDGVMGGSTYYRGHGTGLVSWAPIMGILYDKNVSQWSKGEYPNANVIQDDVATIAGVLGHISDDHGESAGQATALLIEADGNVLVSSPELDPGNLLPHNKGVIDDRDDVDWFYFDVDGTGTAVLTATPSWHSFPSSEKRGTNLDIELSIFDANLDLIDYAEPWDDTNATVSFPVSTGRYFIQIDGVGNNTNSDYSDYASLGMYFLEGYIDVAQPEPDSQAPSPSTMSWQSEPAAEGESAIIMTAVEATDESGAVEYLFTCLAGGQGCANSGWQSSRSYTADGLASGTYYEFKVKARDKFNNQNSSSVSVGVTTDTPPSQVENIPPEAVASYSPEPAVITKGKTASLTLDGSASTDADGSIVEWSWTDARGDVVGTSKQVALKLKEGNHEYTLTVADDSGASDSANLTVTVTKSGDDGGDGKRCNPKKEDCPG